MKISSRPRIIPNISTISVAAPVTEVVSPMDNPTVPSADANSNIASVSDYISHRTDNQKAVIHQAKAFWNHWHCQWYSLQKEKSSQN